MKPLKKPLMGKRFGRLVVLQRVNNIKTSVAYLCECDCGKKIIVTAGRLISGNTKSCGCLRNEKTGQRDKMRCTTHGKSRTRLYRIWATMKGRCFIKSHGAYKKYGARGILVCDEWKNDFATFEKWAIANGYREDLTLDRIDSNGHYCPKNCRWVSIQEQNQNRSCNRFLEYNGEKMTIAEWSRKLNIPYATINNRIKSGWPIDKVLSPKKYWGKRGRFNG